MPELIEVEYYRQALDPLIGECVDAIELPDENFTRPKGTPIDPFAQLVGEQLIATERHGKLLFLHLGPPNDHEAGVALDFGSG